MKQKVFIFVVVALCIGFTSCGGDDDEDITPSVTPDDKTPENPEIVLSNSGKVGNHDCVDLGLSVKWATCNIDATAPEDYGSYFAWGELSKKDSYTLENYSLYQNGSYANYGNDISETMHDAAYVKWGNKWRMPTYQECKELEEKCSCSWVTFKGIEGCLLTGPNGNKLFIPASGRIGGTIKGFEKKLVNVWGSVLWPWGNHYDITQCSSAVAISIAPDRQPSFENLNRYVGCPIRPVTTAIPEFSNDNNSNDGNNGGNNESNEPPYITSFTYTATKSSVTVKFMCNERPTSASVKYGETSATKSVSSTISGKQVTATASGLKAGTKYYFKCTVRNSSGSNVSDEWPAITNY